MNPMIWRLSAAVLLMALSACVPRRPALAPSTPVPSAQTQPRTASTRAAPAVNTTLLLSREASYVRAQVAADPAKRLIACADPQVADQFELEQAAAPLAAITGGDRNQFDVGPDKTAYLAIGINTYDVLVSDDHRILFIQPPPQWMGGDLPCQWVVEARHAHMLHIPEIQHVCLERLVPLGSSQLGPFGQLIVLAGYQIKVSEAALRLAFEERKKAPNADSFSYRGPDMPGFVGGALYLVLSRAVTLQVTRQDDVQAYLHQLVDLTDDRPVRPFRESLHRIVDEMLQNEYHLALEEGAPLEGSTLTYIDGGRRLPPRFIGADDCALNNSIWSPDAR